MLVYRDIKALCAAAAAELGRSAIRVHCRPECQMTCSMCGASVSIWKRDLVSGLCPKCLAAQQQEVEQQRQEDERQRQAKEQADTARAKRDTATRHGIPQVYPDGCPNCGGELIPVLLFAREEFTFRQGMGVDAAVAYYATLEAEQGMFTGRFRIAGSIRASKCDKCHRVHFHGVPER